MEKEEIIKMLEELEKKHKCYGLGKAKEYFEQGDYEKAALSISIASEISASVRADAKDLSKEINALYIDRALDAIRENAASDRISAKNLLSDMEYRIKKTEMDVPSKYDETKKFVYGLAPDQNESDEKIIEEEKAKSVKNSGNEMVVSAKKMVRRGMMNTKKGGTSASEIDSSLKTAKSIFTVTKSQLPSEYPEEGDWKNGWKKDALEYIRECIGDAKEILNEYHDRPSAKQALEYANEYASLFGIELPPEYEDVRKVVGDVKMPANIGRMTRMSRYEPEATKEDDERSETVWQIKLRHARDLIGDLKSSDKHSKEDVDSAVTQLRNFSVTSKIYNRPLPPEFYKLKKLVNWKDPDENKPPAGPSEAEKKLLEELKELKSGRRKSSVYAAENAKKTESIGKLAASYNENDKCWRAAERKRNATEPAAKEPPRARVEIRRAMKQEEAYGLRKELEKSGNPRHAEAVEELRNGHYATAVRLIDVAAESDNANVPAELLKPLYEEAIRDLLNGAMAFEDDPALLRGRLEDVKKYVSRVGELPEDLARLYELLRKKAGY